MIITVYVAESVSKQKFETIKALIDQTSRNDINFNGMKLVVKRGDFTCIDGDERGDAMCLLNEVFEIIRSNP